MCLRSFLFQMSGIHYNFYSSGILVKKIKKDPTLIQFIILPSKIIQMATVTTDGFFIKFIKFPTEKVKIAAINNSRYSLHYIKNPSLKLIKLHNKNWLS